MGTLRTIIVSVLVFLTGCASDGFRWKLTGRVYEDHEISIRYVEHVGALLALCGPFEQKILGCALALPEVCHIILLEKVRGAPYPLEHELRHCKGWSH